MEVKMTNRIAMTLALFILLASAGLIVYTTAKPNLASAQGNANMANNSISVSGTGKVRAKPNLATASIGVETIYPTLAEAVNQNNTKMATVTAKAKSLGIADKDIQTIAYNVYPLTQQKDNVAPTITGYRVNNQVNVTIRKIEDLGKILDAVVAAGANNVYGISFAVDDPAAFQQQARAAAVKDAQDKAGQLAKAAGVTLGKPMSISEGVASPVPVFRSAPAPAGMGGAEVSIETGELEIAVTVQIQFATQ
jgi:hypothetical protein